jgi:large subunit ribosomal protein L17
MRHLNAGRKLGVRGAHKRAMFRNMVTSLLEHGRITTTLTRAKELRAEVDRMIGLGKRGDLHARRQALGFLKSKAAMANLFGGLAERFRERAGGYTRIIPGPFRRGDGAPLAILQLIGAENDPFTEEGKPAKAKGEAKPGRRRGRGRSVAQKVAEDVQAKPAKSEA